MRFVIQRVSDARVTVDGAVTGRIDAGMVILCGIAADDTDDDIEYLVNKTVNLRVFRADDGTSGFDQSLTDIGGGVLVVSQFTLYANTRKGRRPGFTDAAPPDVAEPIYERVVDAFRIRGIEVQTGVFGAMMQVELTNDGPATFLIDSTERHQPRRQA